MATVFDSLGSVNEPKLKKENLDIRRRLRANKTLRKSKEGDKLRKKLMQNRAKANPKDPDTGASIREVEREARSNTQSKYGTAWKSVEGQIGGQKNALSNLPTYYDRRREDLTTAGANQAAAANAIRDRLVQDQAAAEGLTAGSRNAAIQEAGGDPLMAHSAQAAKDASASRSASAQASGANIAAVGAVGKGTYDGLALNANKEQSEQTTTIGNKIASLESDRDSLAKEIGDAFISEKSNTLSRIGDRQVKAAAVAADAANDRSQARLNRDKLSETSRHNKTAEQIAKENAESNRIRANKTGSGKGKKKGPGTATPIQQKTFVDSVNSAKRSYDYWKKLVPNQPASYWRKKAAEDSGLKTDALEMNAAINISIYGKVRPDTIAKAHKLGIKFKGSGLPY